EGAGAGLVVELGNVEPGRALGLAAPADEPIAAPRREPAQRSAGAALDQAQEERPDAEALVGRDLASHRRGNRSRQPQRAVCAAALGGPHELLARERRRPEGSLGIPL